MKLITLVIILFVIISIKSEDSLDSYSINIFIKYLKDNKLFEIIESIKMAYGSDVAIITCEELSESMKGNCQRLVLEHMPIPISRRGGSVIKNSNKMPLIKEYLKKVYSPEESKLIYEAIINKVNKL